MTRPLADHATFSIEREFAAPVARVFAAWSKPEKKQRWFACHDDWETTEQVVFLDGHGDAAERREGTELGLARLDAEVE